MSGAPRPLRLGVYSDYSYRIIEGAVSANRPFSLFVEGLEPHCDRLVVFGRVDPGTDEAFPFSVHAAELVALPFYTSGADVPEVLRAIPRSIWRFWRALDQLDTIWVLGPNPPQALLFAILGVARGRHVVLGVRQNLPELIRHRRSDRRMVVAAASLLELCWRALARLIPVIVVGPDLAYRYRRSKELLSTYVSLLRASDLVAGNESKRRYSGDELVMLSVGRLDPEKNPLLLADILAIAVESDPRWRLEVCGDGVLADELLRRAEQLGVADRVVLNGYIPVDDGLWTHYRSAHVLLHVSLTEGVPQVILEAFAAGLPVVATDVGGVADLVAGRGLVCPPSDARASARAVERIVSDFALREEFVAQARAVAAEHTLEAEAARVADFLSASP